MDVERDVDDLKHHLSLQLHKLLPAARCREMIARYEDAETRGQLETAEKELIEECRGLVFTDAIEALLTSYFQGAFEVCWPRFDVVGSHGAPHNMNALWHLDGGVKGTHKLFIYLNAVAGHGGNTVMVDRERTKALRQVDALPVAREGRKEDLGEVFAALGIDPEPVAYDLKAGDGLLFDPVNLAHRCRPTLGGRRRYTICFSIVPGTTGISSLQPG